MRTRNLIAPLLLVIALISSASPIWPGSEPTQSFVAARAPVVTPAKPPAGAETLQVQWIKVSAPGQGAMLAAVARPRGAGPFPTVVLLHGSHGFAREYVQLAQALAHEGLLAVAACWFSGGGGAGARFITPIECSEALPRPEASSPAALQVVDSLVQAARTLPGARPDRIGLFGHSRGGGAVLNYVMRSHNVQAAALNSAGYPDSLSELAPGLNTPLLILHGIADSPAEGGSEFTNIKMARNFEATLQRLGKSVEAHYYEGDHNSIFTSSTQFNDEVKRMATFFLRHLGK